MADTAVPAEAAPAEAAPAEAEAPDRAEEFAEPDGTAEPPACAPADGRADAALAVPEARADDPCVVAVADGW